MRGAKPAACARSAGPAAVDVMSRICSRVWVAAAAMGN
ncbi:hypothetical protein BSLA_02r2668 [Burkholderia stabilis]|nr:hypothetical protein BSLA_02r2668 [Burkholderia stabilis]